MSPAERAALAGHLVENAAWLMRSLAADETTDPETLRAAVECWRMARELARLLSGAKT